MSLLGIDVGTTGCKAGVFDLDGNQLALCYCDYPLIHPKAGWSELNAENLWASIAKVIRQVNSHVIHNPVEALSVSSQGEAVAPIDQFGRSLGNFIVTFDHRTLDQAQWWEKSFGKEKIFSITGRPLHAMFTINKIMWLRDHLPEIFSQANKFLCVEDFVNFQLAGMYVTDWSVAGCNMAFDLINKCWSTEILNKAGIVEELLPQVYPSGATIGLVLDKMATDLGFQKGVVIAAGGHDQPCGALGSGVVKPGQAMNAAGTSEVICLVLEKPMLTKQMLKGNYCCNSHVVPRQYVTYAFSLTEGMSAKLGWEFFK